MPWCERRSLSCADDSRIHKEEWCLPSSYKKDVSRRTALSIRARRCPLSASAVLGLRNRAPRVLWPLARLAEWLEEAADKEQQSFSGIGSRALTSLCPVSMTGSLWGILLRVGHQESQPHSGQDFLAPWNVSPALNRVCLPLGISLGFHLTMPHGHLKIPAPEILLFFRSLITCIFSSDIRGAFFQ